MLKTGGWSPSYTAATGPVTLRSQREHIKKPEKAESCPNGLF